MGTLKTIGAILLIFFLAMLWAVLNYQFDQITDVMVDILPATMNNETVPVEEITGVFTLFDNIYYFAFFFIAIIIIIWAVKENAKEQENIIY